MTVVVVYGMKELKAALARMSKDLQPELLRTYKEIGPLVVKRAQKLAPKGKHQGSGKIVPIAKSIHFDATEQGVTITAGGKSTPHAAGAEWGGTIPRRGWKGRKMAGRARRLARFYGAKTVTHLKRHPYLMPAVEQMTGEIVKAYEKMVDRLAKGFDR